MTWALVTLLAPSVKATAPAALSKPISAISSPRRPLVSAAIGCTCTIEVSRARLADEGTHVDEAGRDELALAVDHLGGFRHAGGADAALGLADHAVGDQEIAVNVEIA